RARVDIGLSQAEVLDLGDVVEHLVHEVLGGTFFTSEVVPIPSSLEPGRLQALTKRWGPGSERYRKPRPLGLQLVDVAEPTGLYLKPPLPRLGRAREDPPFFGLRTG